MVCKCVSCGDCNGTGTIWVSMSGEYLGNNRCDDFDELESCDECGGSGVIEYCDECTDGFEDYENDCGETAN